MTIKKSPAKYNDIPIFLILIPCINALNYYLTYSNISLNWHTALTFAIDTLEGYIAWWIIRSIIIRLDRKIPYAPKPLKRIFIQILLTCVGALAFIIVSTEILNWIVKDTPVPSSFYTLDIFIFLIWFFVINGIYIAWHYYIVMNELEKLRREEKKLRQDGFTVKHGKQNLQIPFAGIAGIYVEGEYAVLITTDAKKYLLDQSLDKVEKLLPGEFFFRMNRQYILHRNMVSGYERGEHNKLNVLVSPSPQFPPNVQVSRTKAVAFKSWFQQGD
ncbi:MAG: LytTR family transcriptional regulator [Bacteroidetes bacterium]|nr:LytTR family transcriptional regulator [Bacteroidota bacterium]